MMYRTRRAAIAFLAASTATFACSSEGPGDGADAGPFVTALRCPDIGYVPFALSSTDWAFTDNETAVATQPRHKHQPSDVMGNAAAGFALTLLPGDAPLVAGNEVIRGTMARTESNRGFFGERIAEEVVSLWHYDETAGWTSLGEQTTGSFTSEAPGGYRFDLGAPPPAGVTVRYAVLQAEPSCGTHYTYNLAAGTKVIVADIDETLTLNDEELLEQVADGAHDPLEKMGGVALTQAWTAKGYQLIYLTARPHVFRSETRAWLLDHGFADGPIITAPELVSGDSARTYKGTWVSRIRSEFGWNVVAAYGNADSDIEGYEDAGVEKSVTFIIGERAGTQNTVAIENDDFTSHISDYVNQQPDA